MSRRKNTAVSTRPSHTDEIPATTVSVGWGDKRKQNGVSLYIYYGERFMHQHFPTLCVGKHLLELLISGDTYKWETWPKRKTPGIDPEPLLVTARGIEIRGAGLEAAMEYEYKNDEERNFVFPAPYDRMFETWALKGPKETERTEPKAKVQRSTEPRPVVEPKAPRPSKDGLITVQKIAEDNKWDPKHCRAALRKAKVEKPEAGWAFPQSEVARITQLIKENLK